MTDILPVQLPAHDDLLETDGLALAHLASLTQQYEARIDTVLHELGQMAFRANDEDADTISRAMAIIEAAKYD